MLCLLMGLQPVSTDLLLPALPSMSEEFGAPMSQAQFALSAFLLTFGCSQLVWGPLSDRFGRRPVLLWGLAAYVLGALASTLTSSLGALVLARMCQGAAMGAAVMTARAVVRDRHGPSEGPRVMSQALTGLGLIACLSAPLGGLLTQLIDWRAALAAIATYGACALAVIAWRFDETLSVKRLDALQPRELARTWLRIARHPRFLAYTAVASASNAAVFTYVASSSFVLIRIHGLSQLAYGLCMSSFSLSYVAGTVICRQLLWRVGLQRTLDVGGAVCLAGGLLLTGLYLSGVHSPWAVVLPINLLMMSHGITQAGSQNGAITSFPEAAGTAAAMNGFCMMTACFLMGTWLARYMDGGMQPLVQAVMFWSAGVAFSAWVLLRRMGRREAPH